MIQREKHETDVGFAVSQVKRYVETGTVEAIDVSLVTLDAEALCIHGDGPNATDVGAAIRLALGEIGCEIVPVTE